MKKACTSNSFLSGAFLYNTGHPFKEVYITQSILTCADPIEPQFYTLNVRLRSGLTEKLCCFCAEGSTEELDNKELHILFTTALPVCQLCLANAAKISVKWAIRNSEQRLIRVVDAERRARSDAQSSVKDPQPPIHVATTASMSRRGNERGNGSRARRGT